MNAPEKISLPDEQSRADTRNIAITRVGVRGVKYPIQLDTGTTKLATVAELEMTVGLPASVKGTHMSRFLEILEANTEALNQSTFRRLTDRMLERLEATDGTITLKTTYFASKTAPVSKVASLLDYQLTLEAVANNGETDLFMEVVVPVTSLCPCSKNISDYGAHNQRSHITIRALVDDTVGIDDLIRAAEESASCELWGLLKRPDEKYVTERAYDNPKFVEDLVRDVAIRLNNLQGVSQYRVESENFESIHNHSAVAWIEHP